MSDRTDTAISAPSRAKYQSIDVPLWPVGKAYPPNATYTDACAILYDAEGIVETPRSLSLRPLLVRALGNTNYVDVPYILGFYRGELKRTTALIHNGKTVRARNPGLTFDDARLRQRDTRPDLRRKKVATPGPTA